MFFFLYDPAHTTIYTYIHALALQGALPIFPFLAGALLADDLRQIGDAPAGVERADPRPDLPELRMLGGDGHVADHMEDVAAADGEAVDRRDQIGRAHV